MSRDKSRRFLVQEITPRRGHAPETRAEPCNRLATVGRDALFPRYRLLQAADASLVSADSRRQFNRGSGARHDADVYAEIQANGGSGHRRGDLDFALGLQRCNPALPLQAQRHVLKRTFRNPAVPQSHDAELRQVNDAGLRAIPTVLWQPNGIPLPAFLEPRRAKFGLALTLPRRAQVLQGLLQRLRGRLAQPGVNLLQAK